MNTKKKTYINFIFKKNFNKIKQKDKLMKKSKHETHCYNSLTLKSSIRKMEKTLIQLRGFVLRNTVNK